MNNLSVSRAANTPPLLLALQAKAEIERRRRAGTSAAGQRFAGYRDDPAAYAREVLGITWWPRQVDIANSIHHNRRTVVYAGHSVGKTHGMGGIVQWHFDCWRPSITLTTAPSWSSIHDLLWGEIKSQRPYGSSGRLLDLRLDGGPMHYAAGHNADSGSGFQGRHEARVLIVLDEAMGVPPYIWEATNAMMTSPDCRVIALGNPTETSGEYYDIRENPDWNVITISCLDHPNIAAELRGEPAPFPKAVSLVWVQEMIRTHCTATSSPTADAFEFPPASGQWYEPNDVFRSRVLGLFPRQSAQAIWSEAWLQHARTHALTYQPRMYPEIGCDVARYGCHDDQTEILTNVGWQRFSALNGTELVFTRTAAGVAQWGPITVLHRYRHRGPVVLYDGTRANFCITENHNMLMVSPHQAKPGRVSDGSFRLRRWDACPDNFCVPRTAQWQGRDPGDFHFESRVPMPHGGERLKQWRFSSLDWFAFLGWFVSEGNVYRSPDRSNRPRVVIAQRPGAKMQSIRALLTRMGVKHRLCSNNMQIEFTNRQIADHLTEVIGGRQPERRLPRYVLNATPELIESFLDSFCDGDGSRRNSRRQTYTTSSRRLADQIQELLVKLGRAGKLVLHNGAGSETWVNGRQVTRRHNTFVVTERHTDYPLTVAKRKTRLVPYDGYVFCVSTPNRTILTRRNGCVLWAGNSDHTTIYARRGPVVLRRESYAKQNTMETVGRIVRLCDGLAAECKREGWIINPKYIPIRVDDTGLGCLTPETDVLTVDGWRPAGQLMTGDLVISKDAFGRMNVACLDKVEHRQNVEILRSGPYEFSATHLVRYRTRREYPWQLNDWSEVLKRRQFWLDTEFVHRGGYPIIRLNRHAIRMPNGGRKVVHLSREIGGPALMRLLAWYISEGYIARNGKDGTQEAVGISQSVASPHNRDIERAIRDCGFTFTRKEALGREYHYWISDVRLVRWLKEHCYVPGDGRPALRLRLPAVVKEASPRFQDVFLDEYVKGDGYRHYGMRNLVTSSIWLRDDLQELFLRAGHYACYCRKHAKGSAGRIGGRTVIRTADNWVVYEWKGRAITHTPRKPESRVGTVVYLQVLSPSRLLVCRFADGRPFWTHNGGVTDRLNELGYSVEGLDFGGKAINPEEFFNCGSEMWFTAAYRARDMRLDLSRLPDDAYRRLSAELRARRYKIQSDKTLRAESKDDIKRRLGRSPDDADALVLAFASNTGWRMVDVRTPEVQPEAPEVADVPKANPKTNPFLPQVQDLAPAKCFPDRSELETCGNCLEFGLDNGRGRCRLRYLQVDPPDPACEFFSIRELGYNDDEGEEGEADDDEQ